MLTTFLLIKLLKLCFFSIKWLYRRSKGHKDNIHAVHLASVKELKGPGGSGKLKRRYSTTIKNISESIDISRRNITFFFLILLCLIHIRTYMYLCTYVWIPVHRIHQVMGGEANKGLRRLNTYFGWLVTKCWNGLRRKTSCKAIFAKFPFHV